MGQTVVVFIAITVTGNTFTNKVCEVCLTGILSEKVYLQYFVVFSWDICFPPHINLYHKANIHHCLKLWKESKWLSTLPPISTTWTVTSHINKSNVKKNITYDVRNPGLCFRHNNVAGLRVIYVISLIYIMFFNLEGISCSPQPLVKKIIKNENFHYILINKRKCYWK